MDTPALVPVRLLGNYRNINAGEVAGFPVDEARQLIADGVAAPFQDGDIGDTADGESGDVKGRGKKK